MTWLWFCEEVHNHEVSWTMFDLDVTFLDPVCDKILPDVDEPSSFAGDPAIFAR